MIILPNEIFMNCFSKKNIFKGAVSRYEIIRIQILFTPKKI